MVASSGNGVVEKSVRLRCERHNTFDMRSRRRIAHANYPQPHPDCSLPHFIGVVFIVGVVVFDLPTTKSTTTPPQRNGCDDLKDNELVVGTGWLYQIPVEGRPHIMTPVCTRLRCVSKLTAGKMGFFGALLCAQPLGIRMHSGRNSFPKRR